MKEDGTAQSSVAKEVRSLLEQGGKLEETNQKLSYAAYKQALELATQQKDSALLADSHAGCARMLWKLSESYAAHKQFRLALELYIELGNFYGIARCYAGLGIISSNAEDYQAGLEFFEKALVAARKAQRHGFAAVLVANVGNVYFRLGRYNDAEDCFKQALKYHEEKENLDEIALTLNGLAGVYVYTRKYEEGLELLHRALVIDKALGRNHGMVLGLFNIGNTYRKQGKLNEALKQQLKALDAAQRIKAQTLVYQIHQELSVVYDELGEEEKSAKHLTLFMESEEEQANWVLKRENQKLQQFGLGDRD